METPRFSELEALLALDQTGGLSAAARELGISQPAVSQRIKRLEARVGAPLFIRRGRRVELTESGRALLPLARQIARLLSSLPEPPPLVLTASQTVAAHHLPDRLAPLVQEGLRLELRVRNSQAAIADLAAGRADAAAVEGPIEPPPGHAVHVLEEDRLVLALPPGHPLANVKTLPLTALSSLPLVRREPGSGTRAQVEAALAAAGVETQTAAVVEGLLALKAAVQAGWGAAFLPARAWDGPAVELEGLKLVRRFSLVLPPRPREEARQLLSHLLG